MKNQKGLKKVAIVFVFEIIVYFLVYVVEPLMMYLFHIGGSWLTGGWVFYDIVGAWGTLLIVPVFTFLVMWKYVKEPWYWLLWIPVFYLMKIIYYPSDMYLPLSFICFDYDSVTVTVLVMQYFTWLIVMIVTLIRFLRRRRKKQ